MYAWTRLRAYAGLWSLVAALATALVSLTTAAGPISRGIEDRALRQRVVEAPSVTRDITVSEPSLTDAADTPIRAARIRDEVTGWLADPLAEVVGASWGIQRTSIAPPTATTPNQFASLTGPGVSTEPFGVMPFAHLYHQTDLADEITMLEGAPPASRPGGDAIEVMAAAPVADQLGLRVGETYHLLAGVAAEFPIPPAQAEGPTVAITVTGVFEPRDQAAPMWELEPWLLRVGVRNWPPGSYDPLPVAVATLATDQVGIDSLLDRGLDGFFGVESVALIRLAAPRLDAGWVPHGQEAVQALLTDPRQRLDTHVQTGLIRLLAEFERQAAAARAVIAVVVAGLVGTGIGLLVLAARVATDRRRAELALLRARGGSRATVAGRFLRESLLVVAPAVVVGGLLGLLGGGWWAGTTLGLPLPGRADSLGFGLGVLPLVVAVLVVPATVAVASPRAAHHPELGRRWRWSAAPVRVTVELLVLLLAGVGVLLLHRRGVSEDRGLPGSQVYAPLDGVAGSALSPGGVDPYLSSVPVLVGLAAGLLALRLYRWPLRALGAIAARRVGVVGFLGLARAGRVAPAAALPLLVLVLAVAVGGFAGAVHGSVAAARDGAAVRAVGADLRVEAEGLTQDAVAAVAALPGVTAVAAASDQGWVRMGGGVDPNVAVIAVDAPAYQRILVELGAEARLPDAVTAATSGAEPLPVLTWGPLSDPDAPLTVELAGVEYPAVAVGEVTDLPDLSNRRTWVLVPRQALPQPTQPAELLVAGAATDPDAVRVAVAEAVGSDPAAVTVTTRAAHRAELASSGFNAGLTLVFVAGTGAAVLGGMLAIGLTLVVQGAARGRALSLLRTMGLSSRQARALLLVELVPVTTLAIFAGAAAGLATPVLLGPTLGLTEFAGGAPVRFGLDPVAVSLVAGLLVLFLLGGSLAEAAVNRRLGLDQVLRVD